MEDIENFHFSLFKVKNSRMLFCNELKRGSVQ